MSLSLPVAAGGPPPGLYLAEFVGIEPATHEKYGPGLTWTFIVVDGPHKGSKSMRTTAPRVTRKNSAGKIASGVMGISQTTLPIGTDLGADIEKMFGKKFMVTVEETTEGGTRLAALFPAPA